MPFDVRSVALCGVNAFGIEDIIDMDELSSEEFVQSYDDDPAAWWAHIGLEYYCDGDFITSEFVGVSLERAVTEFRDHTFEDIRMMVFTKLKNAGIKYKYKDVKWINYVWLEYL